MNGGCEKREKEEKEKAKKTGKMTSYTKLPADVQNMYVSDEWIADDDGVRKFRERKNSKRGRGLYVSDSGK